MKSIKYLTLIIPLYLFLTLPVFANHHGGDKEAMTEERQEAMEAKKEERESMMEEKKAEMEEKKEERIAERCEMMAERVSNRHAGWTERIANHSEKYDTLISRLREISTKLNTEVEGIDTSELDSLIDELESTVADYEAAYTTF